MCNMEVEPEEISFQKFYTRQDLALFNLLDHPIYIFDILEKKMFYANQSAVEMWQADSLESLLERDFASDMSQASENRMMDYVRRFQKDRTERVREQWTMFPNGGKKVTVKASCSGIYIEPGHMAILSECELSSLTEQIDEASLRGVEMLRHVPVAISQFDFEGNLMDQNPEALGLFRGIEDDCFVRRFVDTEFGATVLEQVKNGSEGEYSGESQQRTTQGPCWSIVKVRRSRDPVTEKPIILYSARDISDVVKAKNEADQANMDKSEMLAVLSHEIRTPLHQVIGFIELLSKTTNLSLEQADYLKALQTSTTTLMTIINDVLDFTKLEAGKMAIEAIPFDPKGVCTGCVEVVSPIAQKKGVEVTGCCNCTSTLPPGRLVVGDPNRIRQVLLNLLGNAVKFTSKGSITLTLHLSVSDEENGTLTYVVSDTGIGISPEHTALIFDKYRQTDASVARNYGGTGLGLAICKILADAMGGSLTVESEVNRGSEFTFKIPVTFCKHERPTRSLTPSGASWRIPDDHQHLQILVAEDNVMNQKLIAAMLTRCGHTCTIVDNGELAVQAVEARKVRYDLLLTDICMPVLDGIEATKRIRSNGWSTTMLPIIGLTASYQTNSVAHYHAIGMNDCIGKPVRLQKLMEVIGEIKKQS